MRLHVALLLALAVVSATGSAEAVDLILHNGQIVTLDPVTPRAPALAVSDGIVVATGDDAEVLQRRTDKTQVIDLGGRTVIPGLNDSHSHVVRGGRFYATELRWDGVRSLAEGLRRITEQAERTPEGQWVRVIGGWSPHQFEERRMPTPRELTQAAPDVPVFVLFLYSRGFLNRAGVEALGITPETKPPEGGRYEITEDGGAILHAEPNPTILYRTIGRLPGLSEEEQVLSTEHFYRELNRFGLTSAVDAGGGGHVFPKDYVGSRRLAERGDLPLRVSSFLFPQVPGHELESFKTWTKEWSVNQNLAKGLESGLVIEGGGEFLAWSAGDYENFTAARPDITKRPGWPEELTAVARHLLQARWPFRIHATYDESIGHILDVFESVHREERAAGRSGFDGVRWAIDHAETVSVRNLRRIRALGGGVAVQARMAFAGEFFAERYGAQAAANAPPLRDIIELGLPLAAGTDATRVASYNPWVALAWLVTGRTVGGAELRAERHQLGRLEALQLYTVGSAWLSGDEARKGRLAVGQYADLAVLSKDYFSVPEQQIPRIESLMTVTGGRIVYAAGPFAEHAPPLPELTPVWSPVAHFGGYVNEDEGEER